MFVLWFAKQNDGGQVHFTFTENCCCYCAVALTLSFDHFEPGGNLRKFRWGSQSNIILKCYLTLTSNTQQLLLLHFKIRKFFL